MPLRVNFSIGSKITDLQVFSNIFEYSIFQIIYNYLQIINGIIKETNNHAKSMLDIAKDSICQIWHDINKDEF